MKNTLKRKLRLRFILLSLLSLALIQGLIAGVSLYRNVRDLEEKSDMLIAKLHRRPSGGNRYFSVKIPAGKDTVYPDAVQNVSIFSDQAASLARRALEKKEERGFLEGYRYRIYQNENGRKIYFLLRESGIEMCVTAAKNLIGVSLVSLVAVGLALIPVSAWVVKPMVENHRKQKEFITAAGHQLKTPLTVISTHAQLLESEIGENPWLEEIRKQTASLAKMTGDLVTLSKAEEYRNPLVREDFDLARLFLDTLAPFEAVAAQRGVTVKTKIPSALSYAGASEEVRQLIRVLMDNAVKYCPEGGEICATAARTPRGVKIVISNPASLQEDPRSLLQRFQRGQSAAGQSGFGLGLAIGDAIACRHGGHLKLKTDREGLFLAEAVLN